MSQFFSDLLAERVEILLACSCCSSDLSCCRALTLICAHIYRDTEASPDVYPTICLFFPSLLVWTFACWNVHVSEHREPVSGPQVRILLLLATLTSWCSVKTVFSCSCTCRRGLHAIKKKITDAPARVRCCTSVFGSALVKCTCASVDAEEEPVPVHINQAAVFGRVIRGVPEASFL